MNEVENPYDPPSEHSLDEAALAARGGWMFLAIVAFQVIGPTLYAIASGQTIEQPAAGSIFYLILLYFLWRGHRWAKWLIVVLWLPVGIFSMWSGFLFSSIGRIALGGVLLICVGTLIFSRSLNLYLQHQRLNS